MAFSLPAQPDLNSPLLGFRFAVIFLGKLGPAHLPEFRFSKVSGLSQEVSFGKLENQSPNDNQLYPMKSSGSQELVLERGMPVLSTYRLELQNSFSSFSFKPRNVMLMILNEDTQPLNSYMFYEACPSKWEISGLDANTNEVIVESLTLTYKNFESLLL
jgi:phage tail-like protein